MGLSFCGMILRKLTKGQSIFSSLPNPEVRLTCTSTMFLGCSWCLGLVLQNTFHLNFRPFEVKDIFTGHNRTSWPEDLINFSISLRNYFLKSQFKNLRIFELLGIEKKKTICWINICYQLILGSDSLFFSSSLNSVFWKGLKLESF